MDIFGLCYPVYNNQKAFDDIKDHLSLLPCSITVVDDGSNPPLKTHNIPNVKLFRIEEDKPWNQACANNLAIEKSEAKVILRMDIDHFILPKDYDLFAKLANCLPQKTIYQFKRFRIDKNEFINVGCNIIMFKKTDFENIGRYDERFCGNYGYEDLEFQFRAKKLGFKLQEYPLTIFTNAHNKTPDVVRDRSVNKELYRTLTRN